MLVSGSKQFHLEIVSLNLNETTPLLLISIYFFPLATHFRVHMTNTYFILSKHIFLEPQTPFPSPPSTVAAVPTSIQGILPNFPVCQ